MCVGMLFHVVPIIEMGVFVSINGWLHPIICVQGRSFGVSIQGARGEGGWTGSASGVDVGVVLELSAAADQNIASLSFPSSTLSSKLLSTMQYPKFANCVIDAYEKQKEEHTLSDSIFH